MGDDSFSRYIQHIHKMQKQTRHEIINTYWKQAHEIAKTGKILFIIKGNMVWKENNDWINNDGLCLKSNYLTPPKNLINENQIKYYLQTNMNIYEIWGNIEIKLNPEDEQDSKSRIETAIKRIDCITNIMSFDSSASLCWYPARNCHIEYRPLPSSPNQEISHKWIYCELPRSQSETVHWTIFDDAISEIFHIYNTIENLPQKIQNVILTSIEYHAQANKMTSGLNKFVNYWASIELLSTFCYDNHPDKVAWNKSKEEKKKEIHKLLHEITKKNCLEKIKKCNEIINPGIKKKTELFLDVLFDDSDIMKKKLFDKDEKSEMSLYYIRNKIAHGSISERDFEKIEVLEERGHNAQEASFGIILQTIKKADKLL